MMNARHRIATVCVLRRRRRQWRCLRRGDCIRRRRWRRSRRARHDRSRCGRGHGVLPQSARQKNVDYMVVRTKKKGLFFKPKNEKKELEYCHVAMDSFGTWLSNGFQKKTSSGGTKKIQKKKTLMMKSKRERDFRESSSVLGVYYILFLYIFFNNSKLFVVCLVWSCHLFFSCPKKRSQ